ncbi:TRAP-type C4-dicarboxylate transport system, small permease component [Evansella caseinilytica]|uniref:TRAP-type C4-dicarboxylate transport system, small permease component n=1 Tax=Evansella caseinilytica TaxID=1503961 RepID=A0A1H3G9X8_9BACI|nr:TRAP transporter small permease [Evansella caseinilytica]SDX99294.1 TRAP-type C4-dicarboxylate transport system, small permease component [Evansella caseinilytica]
MSQGATILQKARITWINFEGFITRVLLIMLVAIVFMEVILRSIFNAPTTWSVGVAQLIFIWVVFLGANRALRENAHVGIDALTNLLPRKLQAYLEIVAQTFILVFLIGMVYYGFSMTFSNTGRIISGTSISYHYITLAIPAGGLLMSITACAKLMRLIKNVSKNE